MPVPAPVPVADIASGYYVRLDASVGFNDANKYTDSIPFVQDLRNDDGLQTFGRYGVGVGYHFNRWLRGDVTFDGRTSTRSTYSHTDYFGGLIDGNGHQITMRNTVSDQFRTKDYTALANGYIDLPVSPAFTPYVGAGLGVVLHDWEGRNAVLQRIDCADGLNCDPAAGTIPAGGSTAIANNPGYRGLNSSLGGSSGQQYSATMAAALMAGFSYKVSSYGSLDFGWRWLHLSGTSFNTTVIQTTNSGSGTTFASTQNSKITIPDQNIQEIRIGYRFDIN